MYIAHSHTLHAGAGRPYITERLDKARCSSHMDAETRISEIQRVTASEGDGQVLIRVETKYTRNHIYTYRTGSSALITCRVLSDKGEMNRAALLARIEA